MNVLVMILFAIWLVILIILHFAFIGVIIEQFPNNFAENLIGGIILILAWWGLMLIVSKIREIISTKAAQKRERIRKEKERLYREKCITELVIEDGFFGRIVFEYDSFQNELNAMEMNFPPFGAKSLEELCIMGYTENDREKIFRALRGIYEHKDEILSRLYDEVFEAAGEYEEVDENDQPYTLEKIRERVYIWWTRVYNREGSLSVVMECSLTEGELELGGHGIETVIDINNREMDFTMEG